MLCFLQFQSRKKRWGRDEDMAEICHQKSVSYFADKKYMIQRSRLGTSLPDEINENNRLLVKKIKIAYVAITQKFVPKDLEKNFQQIVIG